jgi:hypothetical protein
MMLIIFVFCSIVPKWTVKRTSVAQLIKYLIFSERNENNTLKKHLIFTHVLSSQKFGYSNY